jgi:hypothetical protein
MRTASQASSRIASSPGEPRNSESIVDLEFPAKPGDDEPPGFVLLQRQENNGKTAMNTSRLKLKWKWRARLMRYEQEARHAMRVWLMV